MANLHKLCQVVTTIELCQLAAACHLSCIFHYRSSTESHRLKNIDRRSGVSMEVTVGGVTVIVTDYKPKSKSRGSSDSQSSHDTVTTSTSSPDNHVSHNVISNSPVHTTDIDHVDTD